MTVVLHVDTMIRYKRDRIDEGVKSRSDAWMTVLVRVLVRNKQIDNGLFALSYLLVSFHHAASAKLVSSSSRGHL